MPFPEYRLLLVSVSRSLNEWTRSLFSGERGLAETLPVTVAGGINAARRLLAERPYDLLVINAPLPDGFGMRLAADTCLNGEAGVMLFAACELYEELCEKALPSGVLVAERPLDPRELERDLRTLCAVRERLRIQERKRVSVEEKIAEIRLVNQAKWRLIERLGMTEPEAHRYITKRAMDRRTSVRAVAEGILRETGKAPPSARERPPSGSRPE